MFRVFAAFTLLLYLILMFSDAFSGEVDDLSGFGGGEESD